MLFKQATNTIYVSTNQHKQVQQNTRLNTQCTQHTILNSHHKHTPHKQQQTQHTRLVVKKTIQSQHKTNKHKNTHNTNRTPLNTDSKKTRYDHAQHTPHL